MTELSGAGRRIRVALDGMGGDFAPTETVSGAVRAAREFGVEVLVTGPKADIEAELAKHRYHDSAIRLVEAADIASTARTPSSQPYASPTVLWLSRPS